MRMQRILLTLCGEAEPLINLGSPTFQVRHVDGSGVRSGVCSGVEHSLYRCLQVLRDQRHQSSLHDGQQSTDVWSWGGG